MKKSTIFSCLIFASLFILAAYFPTIGKDIMWSLRQLDSMQAIMDIKDTGLISTILTTLLLKYDILRILIVSLLGLSSMNLMKRLVNKKNSCLTLIAFFFLFLLDKSVISLIFVQTNGFVRYFLGSLLLLLLVYVLVTNSLSRMNIVVSFALGLVLTNLELPYAFTAFSLTIIYICMREDKKEKRSIALFLGEILGLAFAILHAKIDYTGAINNLLHSFIPTMCELNFLIILILSSLTMIEAIKVFNYGKRLGATLAIFGMASYLFSSLLSTHDYLNYMTFFLHMISSFYILMNCGNSRIFKRKIQLSYLFKLIYILMICIFGNITVGSTLFLFLIDITLILDFYDQILPTDFLWQAWTVVFVVIAGMNIYIYRDASIKYDEMNFYIANKLECTTEEIKLPSKYDFDTFDDYVPKMKDEVDSYIDYYNINVYKRDILTHFTFRNNEK